MAGHGGKGRRRKGSPARRPRRGTGGDLDRRIDVLYAALGLPPGAKRGERGGVGELNEAVVKIQDYLLRTSERLDHILGTLKNHRELLVKMNQRVYHVGTRERIRIELDVMRNTLSILALSGVDVDDTLWPEIARLREAAAKAEADVPSLRKSKESLDRRFDAELRKYDHAAVYRPKAKGPEHIPGYR